MSKAEKKPIDSPPSPPTVQSVSSEAPSSSGGCFRGDASRLMPLFVFNMSLMILSYMTIALYNHGVVRTLERRFGLNSYQTGFLSSCNDIIHICLVVFMGYFGTKANKPRMISVTVMFAALAGFLMSSPHFVLSDHVSVHDKVKAAGNSTNSSTSKADFCDRSRDYSDECAGEVDGGSKSVHPAYYIFVLAQLISGVGSSAAFTLSFAYVDENAPKDKASFYIGILLGMYALGPLLGLMLAALCLTLPENLISGTRMNTTDSSFIGCWWLGYLLAAVCLSLTALPLFFYPKKMNRSSANHESRKLLPHNKVEVKVDDNESDESFCAQAKAFPRALVSLLRNWAYLFNLLHIICGAYIIYAIFVNVVRYVEVHFMERAFVGSIIAGLVSALAGSVGSVGGGVIMSRCKMKLGDGVKMMLVCSGIFGAAILAILFIPCPQLQLHALVDPHLKYLTVRTECNSDCGCALNRRAFQPLCHNNLTYFSPCIAGCSRLVNNTYVNCSCLQPTPPQQLTGVHHNEASHLDNHQSTHTNNASPGMCAQSCTKQLIAFAVVLFIMSLGGSFARVPGTMVSFRLVKDEERSFALGINSFVLNLFGFIPSPLLFGYLIDKSCLIWERTCSSTGVCLLFDAARLRYSVYGLALSVEIVSFSLLLIVLMLVLKSSTLRNVPLDKTTLIQSEIKELKETDIMT